MVLGIYGASGLGTEHESLARTINEFTPEPRWEDIIFIDDDEEKQGTTLVERPVMNFEKAIEKYGVHEIEFILAFGEPATKDKIFKKLMDCGAKMTNLIAPTIKIPKNAEIGKGCVIRTALPPCAKLGNNVLIQGQACMGHNLVIDDNSTISSLCFIGGTVTIGRNSYIAPGALVRNDLKIGNDAIVGMGAVVTKDVPDKAVVYGNPAKVMRYNETGSFLK